MKFRNFDADLYYFNARWYDAGIGRFVSKDPIQANINWYIYASNNPLSRIDPTGLEDDEYDSVPMSHSEFLFHIVLYHYAVSEDTSFIDAYNEARENNDSEGIVDAVHSMVDDFRKNAYSDYDFMFVASNFNAGAFETGVKSNINNISKDSTEYKVGFIDAYFDPARGFNDYLAQHAAQQSGYREFVSTTLTTLNFTGFLQFRDPVLVKDNIDYSGTRNPLFTKTELENLGIKNDISLTRTQAKHITTAKNIINNHLKEHDFKGTMRDMLGNPVKIGGRTYDHAQEMQAALSGLRRVGKSLSGSLQNPYLNNPTRNFLQDNLNNVNGYITQIENFVKGVGI